MKSVLIIRHAKSSWDSPMQKDFERPLNARGHKDAPDMAQRLKDKQIAIDAFISSPANRAITTANYFAEVYGVNKKDIIQIPELYHAPPAIFNKVITEADNKYDTIAIFSHNPGITEFAYSLTTTRIDDMPTAAVFAVKADINDWKEFTRSEKEFWFFDCPKGK